MAQAQTNPSDALASVQDERIADVEAVQAAMRTAGSDEAKAALVAAFRQRERARAEQAGAASLQGELARQAAIKAENSQAAPAAAQEAASSNPVTE